MKLPVKSFCQMIRSMGVYDDKVTREDKPAPEVRWIIGDDVRIIGFDDFKHQIRLSVARFDNRWYKTSDTTQKEFFTEKLSGRKLNKILDKQAITIDIESSQDHVIIYTEDFRYRIQRIPYSEPLELRRQYLPIDQPNAEGRISRDTLSNYLELVGSGPAEEFRIKICDGKIEFLSEADMQKVQYTVSDRNSECFIDGGSEYVLDISLTFEIIKEVPKDKMIHFFVTDELVRFRYRLKNLGNMNYYQRLKYSSSTYIQ